MDVLLHNASEIKLFMAHNPHMVCISRLATQVCTYFSGTVHRSTASNVRLSSSNTKNYTEGDSANSSAPAVSSLLEKIVNFQVGHAGQLDKNRLQQSKDSMHSKDDWLCVAELQPVQSSMEIDSTEIGPSLQLSQWLGYVINEQPNPQPRHQPRIALSSKAVNYDLITEVLQAINESSGELMDVELASFTGRLSAYDIYLVLKSLPDKRVTLSFYQWVKKQPNYFPNRFIFSAFINCFLMTDDWKGVQVLMDEMYEQSLYLINRHFCRLLQACWRKDNRTIFDPVKLGDCEKWFHSMKKLGSKPDLRIYHAFLLAFNNAKRYKSTLSFFNEMNENCQRPLCGSYQFALTACKELANLEKAEELWKDMESRGIQPDVECYTVLIGIYADCGDVNKATILFQKMEEEGCLPDIQAYTCLLLALTKVGKVCEATRVFETLQYKGWKLDSLVYCLLMNMYKQAGHWHDVVRLFNTAKERGDPLSSFCFNLAVDACARGKNWKQAVEVFKEMQQRKLRTGQELCKTMMVVYFTLQHYGACKQLFYHMLEMKFLKCQKAYEIVIRAYIATGKRLSAVRVVELMKRNHCPLTANVYHLIIPLLTKMSLSDATLLYQEMHAARESTSVDIYIALIMGHIKANDIVQAKKIYAEMRSMWLQPNTHMFSSLLSGYRNADKVEEAFQIYRDWQRSNCSSDRVSFETTIDMLLQAGRFTDAQMVLKDMLEKGFVPNENVLMAMEKGNGLVLRSDSLSNRLVSRLALIATNKCTH